MMTKFHTLLTAVVFIIVFIDDTRTFAAIKLEVSEIREYQSTSFLQTGEHMRLEVGETAPAFELPDQNGKTHMLSDYRGKWVVLYFYPKDMTPGCTIEACNFRDSFSAFSDLDVIILGVSKDSIVTHAEFSKMYELPFPILSDLNSTVCEEYGVWQERSTNGKKFMGINRATFIIDPKGKIAKIYDKVDVKEHSQELLDEIRNMRE